jgi:hypothetical protein
MYFGLRNSTLPQALRPKDQLASGDQFGRAVAVWDNLCLVSATKRAVFSSSPHADLDGVVYVFKQDSNTRQWEDTGTILASTIPDDGFGESVSLYQGTAAVGAPYDTTYGEKSGLVYVYYSTTSSNGQHVLGSYQTLHSDLQKSGDYFGHSVAVVPGAAYYSHGTVLVGAYGHDWDGRLVDSGAVFIFANSGTSWSLVTMIQPSQPSANGHFGWSLSGYSNAVAVGAPGQESAFLYHLEPIQTDCPREGPPEQMPVACQDQHSFRHRHLQGAGVGAGEQQPGHHTYSTWHYVEVLHVQNPLETNKGELFGTSVAVVNETTLTVVVGAPYDNSIGTACGAILILTQLPKSDIWNSWTPGSPTTVHSAAEVSTSHRQLQPQQEYDPRLNIWKVRTNTYTTDKDGAYWMLAKKMTGAYAMERFGQSVGLSDHHIIVGTHPGSTSKGSATILVFNTTTTRQTDSPIYQGPLYMKEWKKQTDLFDSQGGIGDYFGYTVGLHENIAVVGGFLTGFKSEWDIGTGGAYVYDAIRLVLVDTSASSTSSSSSRSSDPLSINNPLLRATVYSSIVVLVFVVFGVLATTLHSNLFSPRAAGGSSISLVGTSSRELDQSGGSADPADMTSSHPLTGHYQEKERLAPSSSLPSHTRSADTRSSALPSHGGGGGRRYEPLNTHLPPPGPPPPTPSSYLPTTSPYSEPGRHRGGGGAGSGGGGGRTSQYFHQPSYGQQPQQPPPSPHSSYSPSPSPHTSAALQPPPQRGSYSSHQSYAPASASSRYTPAAPPPASPRTFQY